jgi:hypothetical protein
VSRVAPLLVLALPGCVLAWSYGCGPSVQSIHEGTVRFEHCYRLDLDRNIAPSHRLACWRQWSETYSYGQTRDRIEYARRRIRYLSAGEAATLELKVAASAEPETGDGTAAATAAPAPTSAHAPPPATAANGAPDARVKQVSDAGPDEDAGAPPFADCLAGCRSGWQQCLQRCSDEPGSRERTCSGCKPDYRACVRRCVD